MVYRQKLPATYPQEAMLLKLHRLRIGLESEDDAIHQQWRALFEQWLRPAGGPVDVRLRLRVQSQLPALPLEVPYFKDTKSHSNDASILDVYRQPGGNVLLHYLDGALVKVPLTPHPEPVAEGMVMPQAMQYGRFEDITFTSLAPLLRRRDYYLAHAFAASKDGQCVLIIGPSHSGKTTTGLALILQGWQLISNDIVLLEERNGRIYALPTPGIVNIRPYTLKLLPQLGDILASTTPVYGQYNLTGDALVNGRWSTPCPVTHLYFPFIEQRLHTTLHHQNRAVALARLMSESMDRWDEDALPQHMTILQKLVRQANAYALHLGQDLAQLSNLLQTS